VSVAPSLGGLCEIYVRVRPEDIAYVKFIFESYETVGFLRTIDPQAAILVILIVPDFLADGEAILRSIAGEISLERIPKPESLGDDWLVTELARGVQDQTSAAGGGFAKK
jgi:uncharacterized protein DUF4911